MQQRRNSIADALELRLSGINLSIYKYTPISTYDLRPTDRLFIYSLFSTRIKLYLWDRTVRAINS